MGAFASRREQALTTRERVVTGIRYLYLTAVLIGAVGTAGYFLSWPLLTSTLGPTAYVFAAHPYTDASRIRNALVGHVTAVGVGVACLAAFGLWNHPSISATGRPSLAEVAAGAVGVGLTMFVLEMACSHHAPAAATCLLITTGLAKPGKPLVGLVAGLGFLLVLAPLCHWAPLARGVSARDQSEPPPPEAVR